MLKLRIAACFAAKLRTLCAAVAVASLAACSVQSPESSVVSAQRTVSGNAQTQVQRTNDFVQWRCMGNTQVQWRYTDSSAEQIDLRAAGDDIMHRLSKRPASSGVTYSDGLLAFDLRGDTGRLYLVPSGKNIDHGCQAE